MSLACTASVSALLDLPIEWYTAGDAKKAVTGISNASKMSMMKHARKNYPMCDFPEAKTLFEHIADACGVYKAAEHGNLVKIYG